MLRTIAVENYRSLKELTVELGELTLVTGPNGSGKSNVYRVLQLLADIVRDGAFTSLAAEGGMRSALYAGKRDQGRPVALRLGFSSDELSYAIDLGLPQLPAFSVPGGARLLDPEVKNETVWHGPTLRPAAVLAERRAQSLRARDDNGRLVVSGWRAHEAAEMSDGTLRFLLLATALLTPRPPELLVLNEPEGSLHPSLLPHLAELIREAATRTQVVVVTHAEPLVRALRGDATLIELEKIGGETRVHGQLRFEGPNWSWPKR